VFPRVEDRSLHLSESCTTSQSAKKRSQFLRFHELRRVHRRSARARINHRKRRREKAADPHALADQREQISVRIRKSQPTKSQASECMVNSPRSRLETCAATFPPMSADRAVRISITAREASTAVTRHPRVARHNLTYAVPLRKPNRALQQALSFGSAQDTDCGWRALDPGTARPNLSFRKRPHTFHRLAQHPTFVFVVQKLHIVAHQHQRLVVRAVALQQNRPIGCPHQPLWAEHVVEPLHLLLSVRIRIWLFRKRPAMRSLYEYIRKSRERQQLLQFIRPVGWAVGHVIDHYGEFRQRLNHRHKIRHPSHGRQHCHGNFQLAAPFPKRRHQRASNPVAPWLCRRTDPHTTKSLLLHQIRKTIGAAGSSGFTRQTP